MSEQPPIPSSREAFEKWANTHFTGNHWNLDRCPKEDSIIYDKYLWVHVEEAWVNWQAAIAWYQAELEKRLEAYESPELYDGLIPKEDAIAIVSGESDGFYF